MTVTIGLGIFVTLFGIYYLLRPRDLLKTRYKKAGGGEIPKAAIITARISGAFCIVAGVAVIVIEIYGKK